MSEPVVVKAPLHLHPRYKEIASAARNLVLDTRVRHEIRYGADGTHLGNIKWSLCCTSTGAELAEFQSMKDGMDWCRAQGYNPLIPQRGMA